MIYLEIIAAATSTVRSFLGANRIWVSVPAVKEAGYPQANSNFMITNSTLSRQNIFF